MPKMLPDIDIDNLTVLFALLPCDIVLQWQVVCCDF